jgi:Uma2 family endonuclease
MVTRTRLTVDEFLALPETEPPSELIGGEVVQKVSPSWYHAIITSRIIYLLGTYLERSPEGVVVNELRHAARVEDTVYLPDINVTLRERLPKDPAVFARGAMEVTPDLAIEVLSPDDRPGRVLERIEFYLRIGVRLVWVVDPDRETVTVCRPGEAQSIHRAPESLDALPVLSDFSLDLAGLFAVLHPSE